ncbi:MAG: YifB family Mg chelatase-like AAA ATPase [Planctomycetota bacterium]
MLAQVHSFVLHGIEPGDCEVELDLADAGEFPGKPVVVGLPDAAVKESIERVQAAVVNSGFTMPAGRITINLAPADQPKSGPRYDLPIAVALLLAQRTIQTEAHRMLRFAGELALDGRIRPVSGVINLALLAKREGSTGVVVPVANAAEASAVHGIDVFPADSLAAVVGHLSGEHPIEPVPPAAFDPADAKADDTLPDFADIRGQEGAKRALMISAAGSHNALLIGPPGSGKTLMARAMPSILPPLSREEALEVTRVYSAVGKVPVGTPLIHARPVRNPHHTASSVAVIGGGAIPRPGEVSLAHHGVLFLDEMPEFPRTVLETLRQPLEDHHVTIARAQGVVRFPARFMLLAAMNPTPKGYKSAGAAGQRAMDQYLAKLSGPLLDRIDLHIDVPPVPHDRLMSLEPGVSSATIREQVLRARAIQTRRNGGPLKPNATLSHAELDKLAPLDAAAADLIKRAMSDLGLSARAYDKVRRVARTLADLHPEATPEPTPLTLETIAEAIQYRQLDRQT